MSETSRMKRGETEMRTSGMGTSIARFCLALMAIALLVCGSFAQSTTDGAIGGLVTDQKGALVPRPNLTPPNLCTAATSTLTPPGVALYPHFHLPPRKYS